MLCDTLQRPARDLRISVTDRCNFRCDYCMPHDHYQWIERREILSFEEITRLARVFLRLGVETIRLTGGEPLLRRDLDRLVGRLSSLPGVRDLSLTTNGSLLADRIESLARAGLQRINVSLDSLDPDRFFKLTRRRDLPRILEGLFAARRLGLSPIKINAVIIRGINEEDILGLAEFSRTQGFPVRFIEYMDAGNASDWHSGKLVTKQEILERIGGRFPIREVGRSEGSAPSVDYRFADGKGDVGVIASVTEPFCSGCTRARLTADGKLVTCLFSEDGFDLKRLLRDGAGEEELSRAVRAAWLSRADRFSENRLAALQSPAGYRARARRKIEMISLGG